MTTTISKPVVVVSGFKPFGYESPGKKRKINASLDRCRAYKKESSYWCSENSN